MYSEDIAKVCADATKKSDFLKLHPAGYFTAAILAGIYVGVGVLLVYAIGAPLAAQNSPWVKMVMGSSFAVALSLVVFAGGELFTGTNMIMPVGCWRRAISWYSVLAVWSVSWLGNLVGSLLLAVLLYYSGVFNGSAEIHLLQSVAVKKMHLTIVELLTRGLLCNFLVCLGVWCAFRMKSESGKLIMIFWCLYAFIAAGFEHSVANMTLLSLALLQTPLPEFVNHLSWQGMGYNLLWVSIGNILGGMVFVAGAYHFTSFSHRPLNKKPI